MLKSIPSSSEQVIRKLYQITNDYHKGFEYQIQALLQMGLERLNLDIAILSKITEGVYTVEHCVTPADIPLKRGDQFEFDKTYCSITCTSNQPVCYEHVAKDDAMGVHPAYRAFGLESYIGIPVRLDGQLYGTLNFSSPKPYPRKFHEFDVDVLQLMASWIEVELIRREQEARLSALNQELEYHAYNDSLTNIPNRRGMYKKLRQEFNHLIRKHGRGSLAIVDIDHFKRLNDIYGHQTGDMAIKETAEKIVESIRDYDFVARMGGEEFLLWLPDTDQSECKCICHRMMKNLSEIASVPKPLTVSIGAVHFVCESKLPSDIDIAIDNYISMADKALYQAKASGRNRLVSFHKEAGIQ